MNRERVSVGVGLVVVAFAALACGRKDEGSGGAASASAEAVPPASASVSAADPAVASAAPSAPAKPVACAAGKVAAGTGSECINVCTDTAPCADAKADCVKSSYLALNGTVTNVRVCRTSSDPAVRDMVAGRPWLNDQVPKELASAAPTATTKTALPPGSDFAQPNANGDCPRGFTGNGGSCARVCTSNAGCHPPNVCVSQPVGTTKVCDEPGGA